MARSKADGTRFGIAEWFGRDFAGLTAAERALLLEAAKSRSASDRPACPFKVASDGQLKPCSKQGGICSIRKVAALPSGGARLFDEQLRCLCPVRFHQDQVVLRWIGEVLLDDPRPRMVSEVPFLKTPTLEDEDLSTGASVGRIDNVLVSSRADRLDWCAVEMQAVYFSGPAFSDDFKEIATAPEGVVPYPTKIRRPDYRSSGPKRLMPQLQIKVPTLRRWGKKMAVVVDEAFFDSLGKMESVSHLSNADIAWFVVGFDSSLTGYDLVPRATHFTTLERAVEGLTNGMPVTLDQFEADILERLQTRGAN